MGLHQLLQRILRIARMVQIRVVGQRLHHRLCIAARRRQHLLRLRQLMPVHGADTVRAVPDQAAAAAERAIPQLADLLHLLRDLINNPRKRLSGSIGHKTFLTSIT